MKNIAIENRVLRVGMSLAVAAVLALGLFVSRPNIAPRHLAAVSAPHGIQIADGSESNGGKGGKGGPKLSGIA